MFRKLKSLTPITIKRGIYLSFSNLARSPLSTASTLLVMTIILFLLNITLLLNRVVADELAVLQSKVDIIVYLRDDADLLRVKELEDNLKNLSNVEKVSYTSKDEALKKFLRNYPQQDNPFEKYVLQNPLPADLTIITKRAEDQQPILDYLRQGNFADLLGSISQSDIINQQISRNVIVFTRGVEKFLLLLLITFAISAALTIINAIHFTIYSRKEEIEVMKLVGARPYFLKLPFLIEGMFYGGAATTLSLIFLALIASYLNSPEFGLLNIEGLFQPAFLLLETLIALVFGLVSAAFATSLYFKDRPRN